MDPTVNVRELALDTLLAVEKEGRQSHLLVRDTLEKFRFLPERDRAFYVRLVEGTLERRILLDFYINDFSKIKTGKMKPVIREILRMAVYQIGFLDSVPDAAAVNEAVKLTERRHLSGLRGFVNGVLRSIAREKEAVILPDRNEPVEYLSICYSVPPDLVGRWIDRYGLETAEKICASFLDERPFAVRLRPSHRVDEIRNSLLAEGVEVTAVRDLPDAFFLKKVGNIRMLSAFRQGEIIVQDVSSQRAVRAAGIRSGDKVIDLCAAPGGKTMLAADLAGEAGEVISIDLTEAKVALLGENIQRCRLRQVEARRDDATIYREELAETADVVIADLPCSGYGVIGRKPEIKYRASEEKERELVLLQRRILANAVRYVRPGGRLLYATCTFGTEENEENTAWIEREYGFALEEEKQFLPGVDPGDGFYYAVLVRPL